MKSILVSLFCLVVLACKETPKGDQPSSTITVRDSIISIEVTGAPIVNIRKVFEAHGGLEHWKNKRSLSFDLPDKETSETHYVDLYSRNGRIETKDFSMGYDGKDFWILDEKEVYKGDPVFYHNLMFYFYAMPFVSADDGINYGQTEPLHYEEQSYPGVRISYNSGVGTSPKDEYFIHYNPETYQMEWLGYTVTYRSGEKSDNVKWIRYDDWINVGDLVLPKSVTWFDYEGRNLKGPRNTVNFENVSLNETEMDHSFFAKPANAKIVQPKK